VASANDAGPPGLSPRLSARQEQILQCIRESIRIHGYPPSLREIGQAVGLASTSSVSYQLSELAEKGYLSRDPGKPRTSVELLSGDDDAQSPGTGPSVTPSDADLEDQACVPLVGQIAAGAPIVADQQVEDTFLLPRKIVGHGTLFMLRVAGDSMINAGITDSDYVVIRQQKEVLSGDIVAALIEGFEHEATVKTFQQAEDGRFWLMPHNPSYAPIPGEKAHVMGKVVAVFRVL
jgi:repressor LexA